MATLSRADFLKLSWADQKKTDLRKVLDPETESDLIANCLNKDHRDSDASMVIYANGVWCFGCRTRWWPDQFLRTIGDWTLSTQRGTRRNVETPRYIPIAVAQTYRQWLWDVGGPYSTQQKWLLDRGLSRDICLDNFIGHTGEAFSIPVFVNEDGGLHVKAVRYRRDDEVASEDRPKYWGTAGANDAMLYVPTHLLTQTVNFKYGILLCEGELDALRLAQEGYPSASLTNGCGAIGTQHIDQLVDLAYAQPSVRITVVYDQDVPGRTAAQRAVELLTAFAKRRVKVRTTHWNPGVGKDVTELYQHSPGSFRRVLEDTWALA